MALLIHCSQFCLYRPDSAGRPSDPTQMPLHTPRLTKPAAFRRKRLLIVGCGDVGLRVARALPHWRLIALTSSRERQATLREQGITALLGDLDHPASLRRLAGLSAAVLHLAPPPSHGRRDTRTTALLHQLARRSTTQRLVYASTSGVYGDCQGARFDETRPVAPANDRAHRRADAEHAVRRFGLHRTACILRIPGIYATDRPGGHPRERVARGAPVLTADEDVFTNHIQADDLARICIAAVMRGQPQRVIHACDDTEMKMGDYFDLAADLCHLPRPPRISRLEAAQQLSPMQLSFMGESRRLINRRLKHELKVRLHYPTVLDGLR